MAALYDVTNVAPPIPRNLTGGKAIVLPEAMPPTDMGDHGLSVVLADSTISVDPDYRITQLGVLVPAGANGSCRQYADALHLGEKTNETDRILVMRPPCRVPHTDHLLTRVTRRVARNTRGPHR
jgi:hypothetical protein